MQFLLMVGLLLKDKAMTAGDVSSPALAQSVRPLASASDAEVIEALRRGDEKAFARLVDQYHASLRRLARLYVSSQAVADEVVQDTWLAVIQGVWAFEGRSSLKTWILRILVNRAKTRGVREGRTVSFAELGTTEPGADELYSGDTGDQDLQLAGRRPETRGSREAHLDGSRLPDPGPSPERKLLSEEARVQLRTAIDALPPTQKTVITMRDLEGYSSEEVCNVLGLGETNQRVILHRARSKVRDMLSAYFREE